MGPMYVDDLDMYTWRDAITDPFELTLQAQQGILRANGGGGWSTVVRGGSDLLSTFPRVKAASDVKLQPICFFDSAFPGSASVATRNLNLKMKKKS